MRHTCRGWALAGSLVLALAGCGGSGGDSGAGGIPAAPSGVTVSGVAATGAAFTDAVITVIDSRGVSVGTSQPVGTDGAYSIELDAAAVAPFVLVATRTDANGATQTLVSVIESAEITTANITPITTLIASRLSPSGDPSKLAEELAAGDATITPEAVADTVEEVQAILAPLLSATDTGTFNPLTDSFATDGTGYDRLLDSVNITFLPASSTTTNIEITVKQELAEGEQPKSVSFSSEATVVPALPTIDAGTLVAEGTSAKITSFLNALTACYALPASERATVPATVVAPACRDAFHNSDPTLFRNNGATVSSTGAFASLFNPGVVGAVFSQGSYEFTRANAEKDIVIGYKVTGADGGESYDTFVLRSSIADGKLRLIGNQYRFPGRVAAYQQRRNFITLDQQAYDYYSTGYVVDVPNRQFGGAALFNRVIVTTPTGATLTLQPNGGVTFLSLVKPTVPPTLTATSFVRLRSEYVDGDTGRTHPRSIDTNLFFAPSDRTELSLTEAQSQGTWKFEYYLNVDDPDTLQDDTTVPEVQYFKNRARALSIAELRTQGLAQLTPQLIEEIRSGAQTAGQPAPGQLLLEQGETTDISTEGGGDGWTVDPGQLPPTQVTVFGRAPIAGTNANFTDSADVRSVSRQTLLPCTPLSPSDDHCFNGGPGYAAGSRINGLHLYARDVVGREFANFYALYQLTIPLPP